MFFTDRPIQKTQVCACGLGTIIFLRSLLLARAWERYMILKKNSSLKKLFFCLKKWDRRFCCTPNLKKDHKLFIA
jgi:hypothetical protein